MPCGKESRSCKYLIFTQAADPSKSIECVSVMKKGCWMH